MKKSIQRLIQDIKRELLMDNVPVSSILRKALVLAYERGDEDLRSWVDSELDGYAEGAEVPAYRHRHMQSFGNFVGYGYARLTNMVLPSVFIPTEYRHITNDVVCRENLRVLETCLIQMQNNPDGGAKINWPGDLIALLADKFYQGFSLVAAWVLVQPSDLLEIVDTVRNRLLRYVLTIDSSYPSVRHASAVANRQVFNTTILGHLQNTCIGDSNVDQNYFEKNIFIAKGDWNALRRYVVSIGVPEDEVADLKANLEADGSNDSTTIGPRVASWLDRLRNGTMRVTSSLAVNVLANFITQAIVSFLGI